MLVDTDDGRVLHDEPPLRVAQHAIRLLTQQFSPKPTVGKGGFDRIIVSHIFCGMCVIESIEKLCVRLL
jgi:hypothetical protein